MHSDFVNVIDTALAAGVFASNRYQRGVYHGIAELVQHDEGTIPMVVSNSGQGTSVVVDDNYTFQIYHRHISSTHADLPSTSFGSGMNSVRESANMRLVIIADRERLEESKSDLIAGVVFGFPDQFTDANTSTYSYVEQVNVQVTNSNLDSIAVYQDEYGLEGQLPPNYVMAAIDYEMTIDVNKNCYTLCN